MYACNKSMGLLAIDCLWREPAMARGRKDEPVAIAESEELEGGEMPEAYFRERGLFGHGALLLHPRRRGSCESGMRKFGNNFRAWAALAGRAALAGFALAHFIEGTIAQEHVFEEGGLMQEGSCDLQGWFQESFP